MHGQYMCMSDPSTWVYLLYRTACKFLLAVLPFEDICTYFMMYSHLQLVNHQTTLLSDISKCYADNTISNFTTIILWTVNEGFLYILFFSSPEKGESDTYFWWHIDRELQTSPVLHCACQEVGHLKVCFAQRRE